MTLKEASGTNLPLFAFAGINGSGKTTLVHAIRDQLEINGHDVYISKAYSDELKEVTKPLLDTADPIETMFIFQALHRRQRNLALGKLAAGTIVLADRWAESYDAYHSQYGVLAKNFKLRESIKFLAYEGLSPRQTFYLKVDPTKALERSETRSPDKFESEARSTAYQIEHSRFYDQMCVSSPNWVVLDANKTQNELLIQAMSHLSFIGMSPTRKTTS